MKFFNFEGKKEEISRAKPGFEEAERKTPGAGLVLLILMFIAGMYFGWFALDDLARVPTAPPDLSICGYRYQTPGNYYPSTPISSPIAEPAYDGDTSFRKMPYYSGDSSKNCVFNDLETLNQIPERIKSRIVWEDKLALIYPELTTLENQYQMGLEERQANLQKNIYPITPEIQDRIVALRAERTEYEAEIKKIDKELNEAYKPVFAEHNKRLRWYEFKVFAIQFLFVLPLFFFVLKQYLKFLKKDSPYTIIWMGVLAVAGLLLLRVMLFWFWGLFLARIIEVLWRWIQKSELIRSLVFYLGMVLSFAVFGGAVYYLQKKIFDPIRVTIRRFRLKQCPHCQTNLDLSQNYCPQCGYQLKEKCAVCGNMRFKDLPVCQYCGNKK